MAASGTQFSRSLGMGAIWNDDNLECSLCTKAFSKKGTLLKGGHYLRKYRSQKLFVVIEIGKLVAQ